MTSPRLLTFACRSPSRGSLARTIRALDNVKSVTAVAKQWYHGTPRTSSDERSPPKNVLVLGSSGALGSVIARQLMMHETEVRVLGADVQAELPADLLTEETNWPPLTDYCSLSGSDNGPLTLEAVTQRLVEATVRFLDDSPGLDAIICASGGWTVDPPLVRVESSPPKAPWNVTSLQAGIASYAQAMQTMHDQNVTPVLAATYLAHYVMNPQADSLVVVLGATAALSPTPGQLAYGLGKTSAHFCVSTLGAATATTLESKAIRQAARDYGGTAGGTGGSGLHRCTVVGILPTMLDTPHNRRQLSSSLSATERAAATATWTRPRDIAVQLVDWLHQPAVARPHSGALLKVYPRKGDADASPSSSSHESTGAVFELVR